MSVLSELNPRQLRSGLPQHLLWLTTMLLLVAAGVLPGNMGRARLVLPCLAGVLIISLLLRWVSCPRIHFARYGKTNDVRRVIEDELKQKNRHILVENGPLGGDPCPGTLKELAVDYSVWGHRRTKIVPEHQHLDL